MDIHFKSIEHLRGLTIRVGGMKLCVESMVRVIQEVSRNIDDPTSSLLTHEDISKRLKEPIKNDADAQ